MHQVGHLLKLKKNVNTPQICVRDGYFRCRFWQMQREVMCERGEWYLGKDVEAGKLCVRVCRYVFMESEEFCLRACHEGYRGGGV